MQRNNYLEDPSPASSHTGTSVLAVPPPAIAESRRHSTPTTESGQPLPDAITDPQAAEPVELHPLYLGDGEQGVGHESVIAEHRVVESPRHPEIVEPRTKTVGDVLRHAARYIEEFGWYQGAASNGLRRCVLGATYHVEPTGLGDDAMYALARTIGTPSIAAWNDEDGRTAAEVIAALRAAADEADR
jgi:hypothetical protein